MAQFGQNVDIQENENRLVITIYKDLEFGPSKSGKTQIIASTGGNQVVGKTTKNNNIILGLNCYFK
jgi:hypothetical protein